MQKLGIRILDIAKKTKMKKLENELKKEIYGRVVGELFLCPFCKYESKKNRKGTAKLFEDEKGIRSFKCFSCGRWRKL